MTDIPMPRLSDSMEEGTILRWLVPDGTSVSHGDELAEIETDKASMVYESDGEGTLHIVASEGDTLPVGGLIAQLLAPGEEPSEAGAASAVGALPTASANGAAAGEPATAEPIPGPAAAGPAAAEPASSLGGRVKSSPLARRLAAAAGLDVASISGTGPGGRVVKADVQRAVEQGAPSAPAAAPSVGAPLAPAPAPAATAPPAGAVAPATPAPASEAPGGVKGGSETVELSRAQSLIARRMAEAKATIPEFTLQRDVDMEDAVSMRAQLKEIAQRREVPAPSFNDLVVKACALALKEHPKANGTYKDGAFELHRRVNVGVAVATADALVVPVVRDADVMSVWQIAAETRRLALAVRDGSITPPELAGGTFSVSNLGMFGIDSFTAVINPPQAAILAVGALAQRAVVRDGQIVARHTMTVTLSCDHRILYGADAAEFLSRVADLLAQPVSLLV